MAVYKEEKTNTWRVIYRYTDWTGERKQSQKRGFKTKREALAWEREQLNKSTADLDMTFASFVEQYTADMKTRIKENTWATKDHIIRTKLLPYFGKLKMCNITAQQIITWQNELLDHKDKNGKKYSPVYLRSVNSQLSAIFNHAVRYYNLRENPCKKAGEENQEYYSGLYKWIDQSVMGIKEIKIAAKENYFINEYAKCGAGYVNAVQRYNLYNATPRMIIESVAIAGMILYMMFRLLGGAQAAEIMPQLAALAVMAMRSPVQTGSTTISHPFPTLNLSLWE